MKHNGNNSKSRFVKQVTVIGSTGKKYTVSLDKKKQWSCSCSHWINTSPREDCKHIVSAKTGKPVPKETKREHAVKEAHAGKNSPAVKAAMHSILKVVKSHPKKYTRTTLYSALKSVAPKIIRQARQLLWETKQIRKHGGKYVPFVAKA